MATLKPIAFLSYAHIDNTQDNGRIVDIGARLKVEVQVQTGKQFEIFIDRDIKWGDNWRDRIEKAIDSATFLIPILSPSFFASAECAKELAQFLSHEKKLKRSDLILPIYYINCDLMEKPTNSKPGKLAKKIAARQHADWRKLRFEPLTSPQMGQKLADLAVQIGDAIKKKK